MRTAVPLESRMARLLEKDPATAVLARGLGANDDPGHTHLLKVEASGQWWLNLPAKLAALEPAELAASGGAYRGRP